VWGRCSFSQERRDSLFRGCLEWWYGPIAVDGVGVESMSVRDWVLEAGPSFGIAPLWGSGVLGSWAWVVGLSLGPLVVGLSLGPLVVGLGSSSRTAWSGLPTNGLVGQRIERASRGPSEPCSPCLHSASATRVMSTKHARCAALSCICDVQPCFACGFVQPCRCRVHIHSRLSASVMYNPVMP
jgi:hypothetical protein